jgi:hypothetical protein
VAQESLMLHLILFLWCRYINPDNIAGVIFVVGIEIPDLLAYVIFVVAKEIAYIITDFFVVNIEITNIIFVVGIEIANIVTDDFL